ncbi:UNVERIFIED_CONTAM: hypothetical protein FKN15_047507 [Acipenser sinensis]
MADCTSLLDEELSSFVFSYLTEHTGSQVRGRRTQHPHAAAVPMCRQNCVIQKAAARAVTAGISETDCSRFLPRCFTTRCTVLHVGDREMTLCMQFINYYFSL